MRKKWRIYEECRPYFITVVCYQRENIFSNPKWAELLIDIIEVKRTQLRFELYEYVIMPDHYHCILTAPRGKTFSEVIKCINGHFAKMYNRFSCKKGKVFKKEFYDRGIRNRLAYEAVAEYIHNNPVKAGLVDSPEIYSWSSARNRMLGDQTIIQLDDLQ